MIRPEQPGRGKSWLPGRFANIRPARLHLVTQVLYFQARHLVADGTKVMRKLRSEAQNGWSFAGITRVFVCIISAAATGNAGLCVAAVVRTALGHVNDVASRSCGACGPFA